VSTTASTDTAEPRHLAHAALSPEADQGAHHDEEQLAGHRHASRFSQRQTIIHVSRPNGVQSDSHVSRLAIPAGPLVRTAQAIEPGTAGDDEVVQGCSQGRCHRRALTDASRDWLTDSSLFAAYIATRQSLS